MAVTIAACGYCCANIQTAVANMGLKCSDPEVTRLDSGLLRQLYQPKNTNGFLQEQITRKLGHGRPGQGDCKVEVSYRKAQCNPVSRTPTNICVDDGDVIGDDRECVDVTVDLYAESGGVLTEEDFRCLCDTPDARLSRAIFDSAVQVEKDMTDQLAAAMTAQVGPYCNGDSSLTDPVTLNIINGNGQINPVAMSRIRSEFRKMHCTDTPMAVGGEILNIWADTLVGGGTTNQNANPNALNIDWAVDYVANDAIITAALPAVLASPLIAWAPGSYQVLEYYRYTGWAEKVREDYAYTQIIVRGIKYDFALKYEPCDTGTWKYIVSKYFDLWCLPIAAYQPCYDYNFKLLFDLGCGDWDCTQALTCVPTP